MTEPMTGRRVLLGVSGGIAAYKTPELVRALVRAGAEVRCVLSAAAEAFVTPLVLQTLSGTPVRRALLDASEEGQIGHIELAEWAQQVLVAPATADRLARMAQGRADDLLGAVLLATRAPVLVAPAMNMNMWEHAATQANLEVLRARGVASVGPEAGELACGFEGPGRMSEPSEIVARLMTGAAREQENIRGASLQSEERGASLAGERVLVTAGGTREPLDAVRVLTNRSSGKMGYALAAEVARRGARVELVSAPTHLPAPPGVARVDVSTALEMRAAVHARAPDASIVLMCAAVADFRPAEPHARKLKKEDLCGDGDGDGGATLGVTLLRNPDILAELCAPSPARASRFVVGFAAESHDVLAAARRKLARKGCDLLVANDISRRDAGFDSDDNAVTLLTPDGEVDALPLMSKRALAAQILDRVEKLRGARRAS